jgi:enhancer of mRNA-decapping protein 4
VCTFPIQGFNVLNKSLHDHANKVMSSKDVAGVLGTTVAKSVQQPVADAVSQVFEARLVPAIEASCRAMFQQTNAAMLRGTDEHMKAVGPKLHGAAEQLAQVAGTLGRQVGALGQQMQVLQARADESARRDTQTQHVLREVQLAIAGEHAPRPDGSATVASPVQDAAADQMREVEGKVLEFQGNGQFEAAFSLALQQQKLELLMRLCQTMDPAQLFTQDPMPLSQPVVLSLIQQLASALEHNTELKMA